MSQESLLRERRPASSASLTPGLTSSSEPKSGEPPQPTQGGLTSSSEPKSGEPPQPAQGGVRSSSKPAAEYIPSHPALKGWVMKIIWPVSCWVACCFFATAVVYTCADIWRLKMLQFKSETIYASISIIFGLVLYGIIESICQKYKNSHRRRYDKNMIMITKIIVDSAIHVFVMGDIAKFPDSEHAMWHDIALSWGTGITVITSILLGRLTVEDPGSGFVVLASAVQPLVFFLMNGHKWVPVYCVGGAYGVFLIIAFLSVS